ncbi:acyl-CoA thioesterase [Raineyella fluvialis]|uniref:Acyl-CoA thioesterase n=1 Tax=Raineyella fluvialis TaxID=2662261 RepID=A0A5Q2FDK4_9ACTN|nr:thioesterase family protein [Raineyella fluvialis]QGF22376.1 acyl-CoA thioesterase [Raineyella fluvialis]
MTPYVYRARVRWADQDPQGHVNNVAYLDYMQEARVDWILNGPHASMLSEGVLVVSHQIEYLAQSMFGADPIMIRLWVTDLGGARFAVAYDIYQGETHVARAKTVLATYDVAGQRLRRLEDEERAWLREFLGEPMDFRPLPQPAVDWVSGFGYEHPLRVRWSELDPYDHVNNVSYLTYLQEATIAMMEEPRRDLPWGRPGDARTWVVAAQDMTYKLPMTYQIEPYLGEVVILRVGSTSVTFELRIRDQHVDVTYAVGHLVLVHADAHGTPVPLPAILRERLRPLTLIA